MVAEEKSITPPETYEWVWLVRNVRNNPDERVPMEVGDLIYICVCDDGKVQFRQRSEKNPENSALWNKASGAYCKESGKVTGTLPDARAFSMQIERGDGRNVIRSVHRRNPEEGDWDGEDDWGADPN